MKPIKYQEILMVIGLSLAIGITLLILLKSTYTSTSASTSNQFKDEPPASSKELLQNPPMEPGKEDRYSQIQSTLPAASPNHSVSGKQQEQLIFEEGHDLYQDGDYQASLKALRYLIRMYPNTSYIDMANIYIGRCHLAIGRQKNDRSSILKAQEILIDVLKRSMLKYYRGDQSIQINDIVDFLVSLSEVNRTLGIPNLEIEHHCEELLLQAQGSFKEKLYTCIGYLKFFKDDFQEALRAFENSNDDLGKLGKARVYVQLNEYPKAILIYENFLTFHKDSLYFDEIGRTFKIQTHFYAKQRYGEHQYQESMTYFAKLIQLFPESEQGEDALFYTGKIFWETKDYAKALEFFNKALNNKMNNQDQQSLFYKAQSYFELNKMYQALNIFNHLIDFYPNGPYYNEAIQWKNFIEREIHAQEEGLIK